MVGERSRRQFLKKSLLTGTAATAGLSPLTGAAIGQEQATFSGVVKSPHGEPISNAEVLIYDQSATAGDVLKTATTDSSGEFLIPGADQLSNPFLVVKDEQTGLFLANSNLSVLPTTNEVELILTDQLLFGPTPANLNSPVPRGMVTVWRKFLDGKQLFSIEVTATGRKGPIADVTNEDMRFASFSLTTPESTTIYHDGKSVFYVPMEIGPRADNEQLVRDWHPARIGLPLTEGGLHTGIFRRVTKKRVEAAADRDRVAKVVGDTVIGTITGLKDIYSIITENQSETTTRLVAGEKFNDPDLNEYDQVIGVSQIYSLSAVFRVLIDFSLVRAGSRKFFVEANWKTSANQSSNTPQQWQFQKQLDVIPAATPENQNTTRPPISSKPLVDSTITATHLWDHPLNPNEQNDTNAEGTWDAEVLDMTVQRDGGIACVGTVTTPQYAWGAQPGPDPRDLWLVKLAPDGSEQWTRTYHTDLESVPQSIAATSDGGYLLTGKRAKSNQQTAKWGSTSIQEGPPQPQQSVDWLMKVSSDGTQQWIETSQKRTHLTVNQAADGSTICSGQAASGQALLRKVANDGTEVWSARFGPGFFTSVTPVSDGYVVGKTDTIDSVEDAPFAPASVVKIDVSGADGTPSRKRWTTAYTGDAETGYTIIDLVDAQDGYIGTGTEWEINDDGQIRGSTGWLFKLDRTGDEQWAKRLDHRSGMDELYAIGRLLPYPTTSSQDEFLLIAGRQPNQRPDQPSDKSFWTGAVDATGSITRVRNSGLKNFGLFSEAVVTPTGRYLVATRDGSAERSIVAELSID